MFRIVVSALSFALFVAVSGLMAFAAFFHTSAWHGGAVGMLGSYSCLVLLFLLIQRVIWRSSACVLRNLFWPTAVIASIIGIGGLAVMTNDLRLGAYITVIGVLGTFAVWRTKAPRPIEQ